MRSLDADKVRAVQFLSSSLPHRRSTTVSLETNPLYLYICIYIYIYIYIYCARSLEYSSSSTLAGLSYHICGKLEVAFKASPSSQHQHCTDEAQKAESVSASDVFVALIADRDADPR